MKINQWLGFNEESSQYLLRRGELRALVNLQPRRPGMLTSRQGIIKITGKYDDEAIYGLYRRDTLVGEETDFLLLQKIIVDRELTVAQIVAKEFPEKTVWVVRRIQGNQERVIYQQELSPNGLTEIKNFSVAEDRHGRLFLFFGHGAPPIMYRPGSIANVALDLGMDAPLVAPNVDPTGEGYFLESVDVVSGGGSYWAPPTITVEGGDPDRPARVKGIVQAGNLVGVDVVDGGSNFKSFPKVVVGSGNVGSGFRAVGTLETDPGVQGFVNTTPGSVTGAAPSASETVGSTNELLGNKVMYLDSPVAASTRTVAQAATSTDQMVVQSVVGISVGDVVKIYSGTVPAAFASDAVVRVLAINESTKTLTLSKQWLPAASTSYFVQFRKDSTIGYADATWDSVNRRYRAAIPLRTTRGVGRGAEATLELSPTAYSYGLGAFSLSGYTTPPTGASAPLFAYLENGWNNYLYNDYWRGADFNVKNSAENATYAGLQASGKAMVYGYSGTVTTQNRGKSINRRADVYWPDYSAISVWVCTGRFGEALSQYTRIDAPVLYENGNPYIVVTLQPTVNARLSSQTGKMSYSSVNKRFSQAPNFRHPTVRINLKQCPDTWVTTVNTNGQYNLPTSVKESQADRLAWWHQSGVTPRPIVDFQGAGARLDYGTIQVIDPGAGWEYGTTFLLRMHQANPYAQQTDYNTAVRESKIVGSHSPFSTTSRYVQFAFQATAADNLTPAGPPRSLQGAQYVDVVGSGYRSGDTASLTLFKRKLSASTEAASSTFDGAVIQSGEDTEFTYTSGAQNPGAIVRCLGSQSIVDAISAGDLIECSTSGVLLGYSRVISKSSLQLRLDKMQGLGLNASALLSATAESYPSYQKLVFASTTNSLLAVGRKLMDSATNQVCTIDSVSESGGDTIAFVTGDVTAGSRQYRLVFQFTAKAGISPAQTVTWTAETIAAGTGEQRVTSVRIISGGRNYFSQPTILVRGGGNGYGLAVVPKIEDGKIVNCDVVDPGRAYTAQPELYTDSTAATAVPVMRPAMRGIYRCAYRFADRSETLVTQSSITAVRGDAPTLINIPASANLKPGMLLESARLPKNTRVVSVNRAQVELSQPATGEGFLGAIVVENPGSGYASDETATCTISGAVGATVAVTMRQLPDGTYGVNQATISNAGTALFPAEKIAVVFSPPAAGGVAATGYGTILQFNPAASYDKSVTVRDMTKPIAYSNFSPIVDVDAGPNDTRQHSSELVWTLHGVRPPPRADVVELWRTSADQSLVFYRLEAYGIPSDSGVELVGRDTLTDEELFDPDRPNYAAMPVVLPNGNLNAYRFGKPRTDMSVCVAFQDRLWYGVSTSGEAANTLFYSEYDEFESCPDLNEIPIQNNQRSTDSLTALVPYGSMLLAMQHAHTYSLTYNTDPSVDGAIQMLTHRGCINQRCWDMDNNVFYAVDESGIYTMDRSGNIQEISAPFREWFTSELIDYSKRDAFFLTVCPKTHILRFFCCLTTMPEDTPAFALCYDTDRKTWWSEYYPNSFCSAITGRPGARRINNSIFGAVDGNLYEFTGDKDHTNQSVLRCEVRNGGSGYRRSPKITCPNAKGVQLKGVISEGRLVDILVQAAGWDCKWGMQLLAVGGQNDGLMLAGHDGRPIQGVEYAPIVLDVEAPPAGGEQAQAVADYAVTTRLARDVTVSEGQSFVRINSAVANPIDNIAPPYIETQDGELLCANGGAIDGLPLQTEPLPVEIGMEAIGDFLPLNCFVSKIVGPDIYLEHPDGTPCLLLGGAPRTDLNNDGYAESGGTQTLVYFRKPFYSHIPFRLATGALQLANETNVQRGGDGLIDRSVTLVYSPTEYDKEVEVIQYFNDSSTPRANVMRRDRGGPGGFSHRQDSASTVLNMSRSASALADATGVAKAMFASRMYADSTGEDQHVQVELHGRPGRANGGEDRVPQKFIMHSMTIDGVIEDAE